MSVDLEVRGRLAESMGGGRPGGGSGDTCDRRVKGVVVEYGHFKAVAGWEAQSVPMRNVLPLDQITKTKDMIYTHGVYLFSDYRFRDAHMQPVMLH